MKPNTITNQELFLTGHALYNDRLYDQALATYQLISDKGAAAWFNMGCCAYRLNNYPEARLYWKRAERQAPTSLYYDIHYNMRFLDQQLGLPVIAPAKIEIVSNKMQYVPFWGLQLLFLSVWVYFFLLIKRWALYRRYGTVIALLSVQLLLGYLVWHRYRQMHDVVVIAKESVISLYAGADKRYHVVGQVPSAAQMQRLCKCGDWYKVQYGELIGWTHKDTCFDV
ncbi:MAG TPA: tetratricopeptide repeat protein [Candidatus Babeliales bacterium]|nr:tetratricopeptide repeat protein [Candidatus Babeliales bacterium]